nr:immunoglobulin light chain junction region [Macaca mulatta]MOV74449.1 immunoglobulin light chain junction region [Macaca mulatta]MOV74529.1 immunoglobulin light chain junction region [Macaca mulatta]MOV74676.1 immunoglobulin light chain junction region [Macaca mulatta]MOV74680.1 immunoglobulin light chain junction region [Macaca mulatta]
CLQYNRAPFTF